MNAGPAADVLTASKQFLVEALENYKARKYTFTVVHGVTAVELALKARLARIHPVLILANIDQEKGSADRPKTVELSRLPTRLANLGVTLTKDERTLVTTVANWRNEIVHHARPQELTDDDRNQLARLVDFLASFLRKELGTPIEEFLPTGLYPLASRLLSDWHTAIEKAAGMARDASNGRPTLPCPVCGSANTVATGPVGDDANCYLCRAQLSLGVTCAECASSLPFPLPRGSGPHFCDACVAAAGEQHIEFMEDWLRGR